MDMHVDRHEMEKIIRKQLEELDKAVQLLLEQTTPATPIPKAKEFYFAPGVKWPHNKRSFYEIYFAEWNIPKSLDSYMTSEKLCKICDYQPRLILRALRRIQAATAWCHARAEGRKRMADEILRQQKTAVEALEAEAALNSLKK